MEEKRQGICLRYYVVFISLYQIQWEIELASDSRPLECKGLVKFRNNRGRGILVKKFFLLVGRGERI